MEELCLNKDYGAVDDEGEHWGRETERLVPAIPKTACEKFYGYHMARTKRTEYC